MLLQLLGLLGLLLLLMIVFCLTVAPDDDVANEPSEEPCDEPSGTRTLPGYCDYCDFLESAPAGPAAAAETRAGRDTVFPGHEDLLLPVLAVLRS